MERFLENKVAVVTGGTRGIGRAIAGALLRAGAGVAICGRGEEAVRKAVGELAAQTRGKVAGKAADVTQVEEVSAFLNFVDEELGELDILINNAGIGVFGSVAELNPEDWRRTLETNLSGVYNLCHAALPRMRNRGGGFIVNISSLAGKNAFAGGAAYNASKFGLNGMSEAMMLDHRHENVRVSYIMPGSVETEFGPRGTRAGSAEWKIAAQDVAEVVLAVLAMPPRTLISRVELRPSKPPRQVG